MEQKRISQKLQELQTRFSLSEEDVKNLKQWLADKHNIQLKDERQRNLRITIRLVIIVAFSMVALIAVIYFLKKDSIGPYPQPTVTDTGSSPIPQPKDEKIADVDISNLPKKTYRYGGSTSWAPVVCRDKNTGTVEGIDRYIQDVYPGFRLQEGIGGSGGLQKLVTGELDFAIASEDKIEFIKKTKIEQNIQIEQIPVARDAVTFAVHPEIRSKVKGLSIKQLTDIYEANSPMDWGNILSSEDSTPLKPFSRSPDVSGTVRFISDRVLRIPKFGSLVEQVEDTTSGINRVANTPGGIYFATATEIFGQETVKPIPIGATESDLSLPYTDEDFAPNEVCKKDMETLPLAPLNRNYSNDLRRNIYVLVRDENSDAGRAGRAYAAMLRSKQGQEFLQKIGYFPLN